MVICPALRSVKAVYFRPFQESLLYTLGDAVKWIWNDSVTERISEMLICFPNLNRRQQHKTEIYSTRNWNHFWKILPRPTFHRSFLSRTSNFLKESPVWLLPLGGGRGWFVFLARSLIASLVLNNDPNAFLNSRPVFFSPQSPPKVHYYFFFFAPGRWIRLKIERADFFLHWEVFRPD